MDDVVIPLAVAEFTNEPGEFVHKRQQTLLANGRRRSSRDVDHSHTGAALTLIGQPSAIAAREDIDLVAPGGQMPGDLADIDVLTAAVGAAEPGQRRSMFTD